MTGPGDPVPRRAEGLELERLEWLPADDGSGLVRVAGRWTGAGSPPAGPPQLLIAHDGAEDAPQRIDSLPGARSGREPRSWHASYVVERAQVAGPRAVLALLFADESGIVLPGLGESAAAPRVEDGGAGVAWDVAAELSIGGSAASPRVNEAEPAVDEPPSGAQVVDRAVLAERRARRAELSEQAQARIATQALKAVELLEQRSAEVDRRLAAAEAERDELRRKEGVAGLDAGAVEDRLRQADARAAALQAELEAERQRAASAEHDAREAAAASQARIEALSQDARAAREALDQASPAAFGAVIERLTRERDGAVARLASERGELRGSLVVVAELRDQARAYRSALREGEAARSSAEIRLIGLERARRRSYELESLQRSVGELRGAISARDRELALLRETVGERALELEQLRDALAQRDALLRDASATVAEAQGTIEAARAQLAASGSEIDELRQRVVDAERAVAAGSEGDGAAREAAERAAAADQEALVARLRVAEAERVQATIRLSRLGRSLAEATARAEELERRAADAERAAETLREELEDERRRNGGSGLPEQISTELQTLRRLAADAAAALAAERAHGDAVREALAAERERVAALTDELSAARGVAEEAARTGENVARRIRERETELAAERARAVAAERARAADAERLRRLETEHAQALDTARSAVAQLEAQLAAVRVQIATPTEEMELPLEEDEEPRRTIPPDPERLAADLDAAAAALRRRVAPIDDGQGDGPAAGEPSAEEPAAEAPATAEASAEPPAVEVAPFAPDEDAPEPTSTVETVPPEPEAEAEVEATPPGTGEAEPAAASSWAAPPAQAARATSESAATATPDADSATTGPTGVPPAVVAAGAVDPAPDAEPSSPGKPVESTVHPPPDGARPIDRSCGWLSGALMALARDDPEAATTLLVALLPGQHLVVEDQPFDYDLLLTGSETYEVTVGPRRTVVSPPEPRDSRRDPMFEVVGDVVSLLEVLCGKRRLGRWRGRARARGRRSTARALLRRIRTAPPSLDELLRSGVTLTSEQVAPIVPYAIDPLWTAGHDFCVGLAVTGMPAAWYIRSVDGAGVTLYVGQPPAGVTVDARMRLTRRAFAALLSGRLATEPQGLEISGEREPIDTLLRWARQVARGGGVTVAG